MLDGVDGVKWVVYGYGYGYAQVGVGVYGCVDVVQYYLPNSLLVGMYVHKYLR